MVRDRVLRIIQGKKLVGYHLPQKMADFGLFSSEPQQEALSEVQPAAVEEEDEVPNGISPKKDLHNFTSEKQKAFGRL